MSSRSTDWHFATPQSAPLVTIAVPSFNQGRFLEDALNSIFAQNLPVEIFVADGGSTDHTREVIARHESRLAGWRSAPDNGQAAAINEAMALGVAPYVCWLNSDDALMPGGLLQLVAALQAHPAAPAAYGCAWHTDTALVPRRRVWVEDFSPERLAVRCIIAQPATLIRRTAWEAVGGLNAQLQLAMDYDLWWRLYGKFGPLALVKADIALNREHAATKTNTLRRQHYLEAIQIVRQHYGLVPAKWWLAWPYAVWWRSRNG